MATPTQYAAVNINGVQHLVPISNIVPNQQTTQVVGVNSKQSLIKAQTITPPTVQLALNVDQKLMKHPNLTSSPVPLAFDGTRILAAADNANRKQATFSLPSSQHNVIQLPAQALQQLANIVVKK